MDPPPMPRVLMPTIDPAQGLHAIRTSVNDATDPLHDALKLSTATTESVVACTPGGSGATAAAPGRAGAGGFGGGTSSMGGPMSRPASLPPAPSAPQCRSEPGPDGALREVCDDAPRAR
jgi:hypothetical protein